LTLVELDHACMVFNQPIAVCHDWRFVLLVDPLLSVLTSAVCCLFDADLIVFCNEQGRLCELHGLCINSAYLSVVVAAAGDVLTQCFTRGRDCRQPFFEILIQCAYRC
jgi:hypothetical protein